MPSYGDTRVMACSPVDLRRWLVELTGGDGLSVGERGAQVDAAGLLIVLRWQVLPPRQIALLRIEQLELSFDYPAGHARAARDWIARFDRHTQRGGG